MPLSLYRFNTQNLSFAECWYQTRSPSVLLLWIFKLLRTPFPGQALVPRIDRQSDFRIAPELASPEAVEAMTPRLEALAALGFQPPSWYRATTPDGRVEIHLAIAIDASGTSLARVSLGVIHAANKTIRNNQLAIFSLLSDQTLLISSSVPKKFRTLPGSRVIRNVGATTHQLWQTHVAELNRIYPACAPTLIENTAAAEAITDRYEAEVWNDWIPRRLFEPLSPEEQAVEDALVGERAKLAAEVGPNYAPVLLELEKSTRANPKPWRNSIWLLAISLFVFVLAQGSRDGWNYLIALIVVLLVHESGHWIAMRAFGYSNLKMLFIPFFGAAVSGRHYNVAGWQKAVVSLAGPAPGIVFATALYLTTFSGFHFPDVVAKGLFVAVVINLFNLLPFLPLDGGWFLNAVLFCRHPLLETGFKVIAVFGLIGINFLGTSGLLIYIAIFTALSIPSTWRRGKI